MLLFKCFFLLLFHTSTCKTNLHVTSMNKDCHANLFFLPYLDSILKSSNMGMTSYPFFLDFHWMIKNDNYEWWRHCGVMGNSTADSLISLIFKKSRSYNGKKKHAIHWKLGHQWIKTCSTWSQKAHWQLSICAELEGFVVKKVDTRLRLLLRAKCIISVESSTIIFEAEIYKMLSSIKLL